MRFIDLTGQIFNRLTVLSVAGKNKHGQYLWKLRCECGKELVAVNFAFVHGHTKSCGCLGSETTIARNKKRALPPGIVVTNVKLKSYKEEAKNRNLCWQLTDSQALQLFKENCYYCGIEPQEITRKMRNYTPNAFLNGIDRVDNSKGYQVDNCVSCCKICQQIKHACSLHIAAKMIEFISKK
jgi:hypothetical protein